MPTPPKNRPYQPDAQECAVLLLLLVQGSGLGKERSRFRLAEMTLKRLWGRHRVQDDFLREVQEWLFRAGWALFYAGKTFGLIKSKSVEGWTRVASRHLAAELEQVGRGQFDFGEHYSMLREEETGSADEE